MLGGSHDLVTTAPVLILMDTKTCGGEKGLYNACWQIEGEQMEPNPSF